MMAANAVSLVTARMAADHRRERRYERRSPITARSPSNGGYFSDPARINFYNLDIASATLKFSPDPDSDTLHDVSTIDPLLYIWGKLVMDAGNFLDLLTDFYVTTFEDDYLNAIANNTVANLSG